MFPLYPDVQRSIWSPRKRNPNTLP